MYQAANRTIGKALIVLTAVLVGAAATAQPPRLTAGGSRAASGIHSLHAGFTPDPFAIPLRLGGAIDVGALRLGPGCHGFASAAEPDVILRFSGAASFLRFFVRSEHDATLIIHDPAGRYLCNDDVIPGRDHRPMVDLYQPRAGQYDVWVGAARAGERSEVTLFITALRSERP